MGKLTTIKFKRDFSPRKKGEVAELETKLANYYLSIGVAELPCEGCDDKEPCKGCNENAEPKNDLIDENPILNEEVSEEKVEHKKHKKHK